MGEVHADRVPSVERPLGCRDLETGARIEVSAGAMALVLGVASASGAAQGAAAPDPASETWRELERRLEELTEAAEELGWRLPRTRDPRLAREMAVALDTLLVDVAKGHGALDLAIGDGLLALGTGLRAMHLGYSNIGDYAREALGLNASTRASRA